jgi:4'-phosphopantetheinyl transferase
VVDLTQIFLLDTQKHKEAILSLCEKVSEGRRLKAEKMPKEDSKLLTLGAEICLSFALNRPLPITYETFENGKPFIEGEKHFSISHSGKYAVCAVSDSTVGVDVELIDRMRPNLADRILSKKEWEFYLSLPTERKMQYLCLSWTIKEAYLKASGIAFSDMLSLDLDKLDIKVNCEIIDGYMLSVVEL